MRKIGRLGWNNSIPQTRQTSGTFITAWREAREAGRKVREQKAKEAHERLLDQIVGAAHRKTMRDKRLTGAVSSVAGCLKFFVRERRNAFSAEAITAFINRPDNYPLTLQGGARQAEGRRRF